MAKLGVASVARCSAASLSEPLTSRWPRSVSIAFCTGSGIQCGFTG